MVVLEKADLLTAASIVSGHEEGVDRERLLSRDLGMAAENRAEVLGTDCVEQWDKGPRSSMKMRGRRSCASRHLDRRIACRYFE